mgnify:CR=1 FL=1
MIQQMALEEAGEDLESAAQGAFDSVINRIASERFPDSVEKVLEQRHIHKDEEGNVVKVVCAYSYICDDVHPTMTPAIARQIDDLLLENWVAYVHGEYEPHSPVTSYVTPWAYAGSMYHQRINCVGYDGYHYHFLDEGVVENAIDCTRFVRPTARPAYLLTKLAPEIGYACESGPCVRPRLRPDNLVPPVESTPVPSPDNRDEVEQLIASVVFNF